jgi:activator of 2-hydroxyglutaryl-CoA dehydratase
MAGRNVEPPILFAGGVAKVSGMENALQRALGRPVAVAPEPQMTGALGAALLARRHYESMDA